jgi:hypothetical protein|tara:strand:- start:306 stop:494 length:189 start_codon:yes stop_codon:yes gene_type:complete
MDYFESEELNSICYIDKKTNHVVIRFIGFPNKAASELFTGYIMSRLGFEVMLDDDNQSKMIH